MKILVFNGAMEHRETDTSNRLSLFLNQTLSKKGFDVQQFNLAEAGIPLFDTSTKSTPRSVELMNIIFREVDIHIWLTPLYHGSMTGAMKNCLDWLECSAGLPEPYLTRKTIGLVCWADGVQAMQGINAMDSVAKALRAWTAPLSIPIKRGDLFNGNELCQDYQKRFDMLLDVLTIGPSSSSKNSN